MRISNIDRIFWHTLVLPFAYLATNRLERWLCETKIFLLYGFYKFLHVTPQGVALTPHGECIIDMAQGKERLYNFWSLDSQKRGTFLHILSASNLSVSKMSSLRNSTMGSIRLGPTLTWWTWITSPFTSVGLYKSSIRITRGKLCTKEVASVARKSACVFPLLGMCSRLNDTNFDCKCLSWLKYPCILSSLASSSPPHLANVQSWVWKYFHWFSPYSLNHGHSFQQNLIFNLIVCGWEAQF